MFMILMAFELQQAIFVLPSNEIWIGHEGIRKWWTREDINVTAGYKTISSNVLRKKPSTPLYLCATAQENETSIFRTDEMN